MDLVNMWVMDIVGPAILLILLIWLVIRAGSSSSSSDNERTDLANRDTGGDVEQRRHGGTDGL